jgi:UPF0755 protein
MKKNILLMFSATLLIFLLYAATEFFLPVQTGNKNVEIEIPQGATFRQAVEILAGQNLIRDKRVFLIVGRLTGADRKIRAGFYSLWTGKSPAEILKALRMGRIIEYEVKILEGDSLLEISEAFAKTGIITPEKFMDLAYDRNFLSSYTINAPSIEGYLFPDTYFIPKGMKAEEALDTMISRMREKFTDKLTARAQELGMTENQVLTLASIIEKEAIVDSERGLISAVYHNRLRKKMPLQADPTAIYGIKSSKERITLSDLKQKTPYNTYVIKGLPPGPIASPGLKSIVSALYPENVPYIYFVSQDDRTHRFSQTAVQHAEAVRQYRMMKQGVKTIAEEGNDGNGPS